MKKALRLKRNNYANWFIRSQTIILQVVTIFAQKTKAPGNSLEVPDVFCPGK